MEMFLILCFCSILFWILAIVIHVIIWVLGWIFDENK